MIQPKRRDGLVTDSICIVCGAEAAWCLFNPDSPIAFCQKHAESEGRFGETPDGEIVVDLRDCHFV